MSRSVAWRNKPTNLITQMIPVASEYKLYLVHETGPTSFVFKDDNDNKFKVSIGATVNCSCGIVQNDHCIHTLYVLLKKFKVPPTNPIIWQASYLDSELQGLVQLKYAEKKKETIKKHQFKRVTKSSNSPQEVDDFPPLQQDSMCPICYEEMNGECYSTCKICKKSLHTKCFKVWSRHKEDSHLPVTCPMCRSEFQNPMVIIFKDLERWESRFSTHKGSLCKGCGMKNIKGIIFKCLLCSGADLCRMCFEGNQHSEHDRFFTKTLATDPWKAIPVRVKKTKKQLFQPLKELTTKDLSEIEADQFVVDLFPTLKEYNSVQTTVQLGIVGNEILPKQLCFKCKTGGSEMMKRLWCGHALHQECLRSMLYSKQYVCQLDNQIFAPGYFQALGVKVVRSKKKQVQCVVLKNQEEIGRINDKMNKMEINGFVPVTKTAEKRNQSMGSHMTKSKDKNFRIMKKTLMEKKEQPFGAGNLGLIMVTGLGHQIGHQSSLNAREGQGLPPRFRSNLNTASFR